MRAARNELTCRIRLDLSDQVKTRSKGESGVVLAEEVQQALHRHLIFNQVTLLFFLLHLHLLLFFLLLLLILIYSSHMHCIIFFI